MIVAGARTPMGRLLGSLKDLSGADLGGVAIRGALQKAGVAPEAVEYVIMGQVLTAGAGQIPARQAAAKAGIPLTVPSLTINKVCLSGVDAIALADQAIRAGEFEVVVAGGQESMSQAPHLLPTSRTGVKYGDATLHDHMAHDGLWDVFTDQAMGNLTEAANTADQEFSRVEQDAFSARSHQARRARLEGRAVRRGGRRRRRPAAQGRPRAVPGRRGRARRHDRRVARPAAAGVPARRHHHRRVRVADLGRRGRGRRDEPGEGRGAWAWSGWPRSAPTAWWPAPTPRCSSSPPTRSGRRSPRRASSPATSTSSRSTRRSPRSASRRRRRSASTPRS
nr:beta-ketoacyl synthase N-terminal-like domain-containing protein [Angustibacter aerolatus]